LANHEVTISGANERLFDFEAFGRLGGPAKSEKMREPRGFTANDALDRDRGNIRFHTEWPRAPQTPLSCPAPAGQAVYKKYGYWVIE